MFLGLLCAFDSLFFTGSNPFVVGVCLAPVMIVCKAIHTYMHVYTHIYIHIYVYRYTISWPHTNPTFLASLPSRTARAPWIGPYIQSLYATLTRAMPLSRRLGSCRVELSLFWGRMRAPKVADVACIPERLEVSRVEIICSIGIPGFMQLTTRSELVPVEYGHLCIQG